MEDSATSRRWNSQRCRWLFRREFRPKTGSRFRRPGRGGRGQSAHASAHTSAGVRPGGDLPTHRPTSRRPTGLQVALRSLGGSENPILRIRRPKFDRKGRGIWISGFALLRVAGRSTTLRRRLVRNFHRFFRRGLRLKTGSGVRGLRMGARGGCFGGDLLTHRLIPSFGGPCYCRKVSGGSDFGSLAPTLLGERATFRRHISRYRCWPFQRRFRIQSGPGMRESGDSGYRTGPEVSGIRGRAPADVGCTGGIPIALEIWRIRKSRFQGVGDASRRVACDFVAPPFSSPPSAVPEGACCENRAGRPSPRFCQRSARTSADFGPAPADLGRLPIVLGESWRSDFGTSAPTRVGMGAV